MSAPAHVMRSAGASWIGLPARSPTGETIVTVGAIVNEKNVRSARGPTRPSLSTAATTNVWNPRRIVSESPPGDGFGASNTRRFSLSVVVIHSETVIQDLPK